MAKKKSPKTTKKKTVKKVVAKVKVKAPAVEEKKIHKNPIEGVKVKGKSIVSVITNPNEIKEGTLWLADAAMAESFDRQMHKRIHAHSIELFLKAGPFLGKRTSVYGDAHMGKSTLVYRLIGGMLRTCIQCGLPAIPWQGNRGTIYKCKCGKNDFMNGVLVDTEASATPDYLRMNGVYLPKDIVEKKGEGYNLLHSTKDIKEAGKLLIFRPINLEQMYATIRELIIDGRVQFVVMDTLNSLLPEEQEIKDEEGTRAASARTHWRWLKKLNVAQERVQRKFGYRATILWTNHVTANMQFGFSRGMSGDPDQETGGKGVKGFADQRIKMWHASKNSTNVLGKDAKKSLDYDVVTEYYFQVVKSKTGILTGKSGSYAIFEETYHGKSGTYLPGMTDEINTLYGFMVDTGLWSGESGKGYRCLGKEFRVVKDCFPFFAREDIQYECRYWIGRLLMPDLARSTLKLEDFFYSPHKEEIARVKKVEEEFQKIEKSLRPVIEEQKESTGEIDEDEEEIDLGFGDDEEEDDD